MKLQLLIIFICASLTTYSQENINIQLIANVEVGERGNDIWGFVDDNGIEYAVMGSRSATRIYSLEDINNPIERAVIDGEVSTWRDIKHYDNYLYVTCDTGQDGLLIIDMTNAPETIDHKFWKPVLDVGNGDEVLQKCHNLYIDAEEGWCYLAGCNMGVGGITILDVHTDPLNPILVGATNEFYSHDVVVRGDTIYSSEIEDGHFSVYDAADKSNPVRFIMQPTTSNFSHSAWPSNDGKYLFTSDERPNASLDAYDISDPSDVSLLDRFRPLETIDSGLIPHNPHYHNGYIYMSWNSDGLVIIDASKPDNLVKVGAYDTYFGAHGGFNGIWGVYPFLPSGYILASDRDRGLFIFETTIDRACLLEGRVIDKATSLPINGATIEINSEQLATTVSDAAGDFKTGLATANTYSVRISKPGYFPEDAQVDLQNGMMTEIMVELEPLPSIQITGRVIHEADGTPIEGAQIIASSESEEIIIFSESDGTFILSALSEPHKFYTGIWGYNEEEITSIDWSENNTIEIALEKGYKDDFVLDQGWIIAGTDVQGRWVREVPSETIYESFISNPGFDSPIDELGDIAYITGNGEDHTHLPSHGLEQYRKSFNHI